MTKRCCLLILFVLPCLVSCQAPRSLETAQMAPMLQPQAKETPVESRATPEPTPSKVSIIGARSQVEPNSP